MGLLGGYRSGNAIVEYVLPLFLVVIGGGVIFWMTQAPNTILQMFGNTVNAQDPANPGTVQPYGTLPVPAAAANLTLPAAGEESFCYVSGLCFNIPTMSGANETSGSLGSETLYRMANMLRNMANELNANDENPDLVNLITQLALKAHEMGDQHALLEDFCGFGQTCLVDNSNIGGVNNVISGMDPLRNDFNNLLTQVRNEFANNGSRFPETESLINYQAQGILNVVNGIGISDGDGNNNFSLQNPQQYIPQRANTVCGAGGGSTCFRRNVNGQWVTVTSI